MSKKPGKKNESQKKDRKHETCECGLRVRCGNVQAHCDGLHHKRRVK